MASTNNGSIKTGSQKSGSSSGTSGKGITKDTFFNDFMTRSGQQPVANTNNKGNQNSGRPATRVNGERTASSSKTGDAFFDDFLKKSGQKSSSGKSLTAGGLRLGARDDPGLTGAASAKAQAAVEDVRASESGLQLGQWDPDSLTNRNLTGDNHTPSSAVPGANAHAFGGGDWDWTNRNTEQSTSEPTQESRPAATVGMPAAGRTTAWSQAGDNLKATQQLGAKISFMGEEADPGDVMQYNQQNERYFTRPEQYTADNIEDYMDRAYYLAMTPGLSDEEKQEAQEILDVIEPKTGWKKLTKGANGDYYNKLFQTNRPEAFAVSVLAQNLNARIKEDSGFSIFGQGFARGAGLSSVGQAAGNSITAEDEASQAVASALRDAATGLQLGEAYAQNNDSLAYGAGSLTGNLLLMHGIGSLLGGPIAGALASGGSKLAALGKVGSVLAKYLPGAAGSAATFGTLDAIQNLGAVASGEMSTADYLKSIGISAGGGTLGSVASQAVSAAGLNFLREKVNPDTGELIRKSLMDNRLARTIVSGISGVAFVGGDTTIREISNALNYGEDYHPDVGGIIQNAAVAFAFSAFHTWASMPTEYAGENAGTATSIDTRGKEFAERYFPEAKNWDDAKSKYRKYMKEYHPDIFQGDAAEAERITKEINLAREWLEAQAAAGETARARKAEAESRGDTKAAAQADAEMKEAIALLTECASDPEIAPILGEDAQEAIEILNAMAAEETTVPAGEVIALPGATEPAAEAAVAARAITEATGTKERTIQRPALQESEKTDQIASVANLHSPIQQEAKAEERRQQSVEMQQTGSVPTSTKEMGVIADGNGNVVNAAGGGTLIELPEQIWDSEMQLVNAWSQEAIGMPVRYVQGNMYYFTDGNNGQAQQLDAAYTDEGIIIRADSDTRTVTRIFEEDILEPLRRQEGAQDETAQQDTAQEKQGLLGQEEEVEGTGETSAGGGQSDTGIIPAAAGTEAAVGTGETPAGGSTGRDLDGRTGGEGGRLDSDAGTGRGLAGTAGRGGQSAGDGIRNALRQAGARSISSQELGLSNGTTQQTLMVVPEEMLQSISATRKGEATSTDNLKALAYAINQTTGCTVDFVAGPIGITGTDGKTHYVNGFFDPEAKRIVVRTDSDRYTPRQIGKHEEFHALAKLYPKLVKNVRDNILEQYGRRDLTNIIRTYQEKRRGINDIQSGRTDLFSVEAEELLEEIFADANGRMNAFDAGATRYWAATRRGIADQQDRAFRERLKANATDRRRGPPEMHGEIAASIDEQGPDASTNVDTETKGHTPEEIAVIKEYQAATDNDLAEFALDVLMSDSDEANGWFYALEPVSDRAAADMQRITGVDAHGYRQGIHGSRINHIDIHHGKRSGGDKSMKDINDVARMQYIIDHYDNAEPGKGTSAYRTNRKDGTQGPSKTVVFSKKVDNTYYLVEAVPDTAAKTVYVVSAYMQKNNPGGENAADANAPTSTAKTEGSQTPGAGNSITPDSKNSNRKLEDSEMKGAAPKRRKSSPMKFSISEEDDGNEWYQLSLDDISNRDLTRSEMHPAFREKLENADALTERVQDVFRGMDPENELWMSPDEIEDAMDFNPWQSNLTLGDMHGSDEVLQRLSDLAATQDEEARTETYKLMEDILPHLDASYRERWTGMDERREPIDRDFAEWYNDKHPSLYYPGYTPGDLFKTREHIRREVAYLEELISSGSLTSEDYAEANILLEGLRYSLKYREQNNRWPATIYYSVDEDSNLFGEELEEETEAQPEEPETASLPGAKYGSRDVTFNDTEEVPFRYAVVPLGSLTVSNDVHGNINPAYPQELQPRDRTRLDSLNQTQKIANNLIPQKLEADSSIQNGAPVVRSDGVVVSGNGRSLAMMMAYDRGKADGYVEYLKKNAAKWGLTDEDIPEDRPVLVRVAADGQDWTQLARDANVSTIAGRSASEQARTDARNLERHPEVLNKLITDEDGNLNIPANRDFISDFIQSVIPENERNEMHTKDGLLTQDGLARVQRAIFEAAYGDAGLLERLSERLDNDMKNVTNALLAAAPNVVAYENEVTAGTRYDIGLRNRVLEAVKIYTEARQAGQTVAQRTANLGLDEAPSSEAIYIARFIERNKASGKQLRTMFNALSETADELGDPNQIGFFSDEEEEKDFDQVLEGAIRKYEEASGRQLPRPERWGAGTLEEVSETAGLRGSELDSYYLNEAGSRNDERGVDAQPDAGDRGGSEEEAEPVREGLTPGAAEDGRRGPELGRIGEESESEPEGLRVGAAEEPAAELSEGARRRLEEKRRTEKEIERARKKGPQRKTKFPDYNPVSEDSGKNFREIAGEIRSRAAAERAKRMEHVSKEKFFGTESLQKLGVKIEGALGNYTGTKQLREIERAARQLKAEIRRQEKILNATDKEKQMARGLAAGVYTMEDFGSNVRKEILNTLADYYEYERTINDDMVLQRRRDINTQLDDQIQEMLPDDPGYKIPPMFVLNHRTPERICRNIWGDEKGKEVYEKFFRPVAVNEAEKIRFAKKQFDDVREIEGSDGKKSELTRDEAMLAQQVLEGRAAAELVAGMELEDGRERIEAVAENIVNGDDAAATAQEYGLSDEERGIAEQYARWLQTKAIYDSGEFDTVKIDNAVKIYQEKYNLFYDAINDFLVAHGYKPIGFIRGYAPHMQMQEDLNVFAGYLKSLGINDDVTRLPANIAGRTADLKPNKRWNPYFLHRNGNTTDFDIAKGFQNYVTYMSDVLYHTDDTMRIRALSRHYRALYAPDNIRENLDWAKHMNSTTPEVKREQLQKRGILSRDAALSEEEVNDAFDKWIEEQFASIENTTKYSDLVMYLDNYANILAGKQSMSDRGGEYDWGRESLTKANRLISAFARTQVAGNLSSAFSQLSQIPMIQAELGAKYVTQAVRDYANGTLKKAAFAQQSDHLTERAGSGALVTDRYDMVMDKLFNPLRLVDGFTASIAVRAKYLQQVEAGKSHREALKEADAYAKRVQGSRAKGSKPLAFHSKKAVNQALHLFQLELFNSWEHVSQDLPADFREIERTQGKKAAAGALAKVILSYLMTAFLLNRLTEETYGGTPAPFDLLGITSNFIASGYGLTTNAYLETIMDNVMEELIDKRIFQTDPEKMRDEFKLTDAADGAWYEVGSDIPFLRNIMGLMGMGDQTLPIPLMGLGDELKYLVKDVKKDIENGKLSGQTGMDLLHIMNQVLPGGRQMTKTEEGLQLMTQGGRYVNGKLYYPVENTFGNWAKAILFGRSAVEESDAYYAGDDHALSVGATELYKMLTDQGSAENREAYDALQTAKNLNDDQTEWLRNYAENGGDSWAAWQTMQQYKAADNDKTTGSLEKGKQTRAAITNAVLSDKERLELYRVMDKNNEGKADKLETIMETGLSWAEAVQVYDAYAEIEANENLSKKEQAERWASWVNRQNYTDAQKDTIRDTIKFWGSYAIEDTTVDKMTIAGLDADAADKVTAILNGLEPEAGRDKVTDLQKYKAIAGSDLSEDEQWQAIIGLTPESYTSTLAKITVMQDYGISPDIWTKSKQAMYDADDAGNNNDSTDQKEAKAALDGMDIPKDQKAILWQLTNKSWSWKNNPYDTDIGQEVYGLLHDGDTGKGGSTKKKKSGGRGGGRRGGGRGGKKSGGGLELGAAFETGSGHSGMFDSILLGWKRGKYSRAQILAFVKAGILTQEEADEILATMQETEAEETDGGLTLGAAEG